MFTVQSPMTVADYCAGLDRGELQVNQLYQRSDKVWPPAARSFLIETIILGYPLPKIFLFQKTDLKSKKTVKEIVDGQQRTRADQDADLGGVGADQHRPQRHDEDVGVEHTERQKPRAVNPQHDTPVRGRGRAAHGLVRI